MQWSLEQIYKKRVINEDVEVSFKNEDGSVDTYKLEDTYAKILKRQIKVEPILTTAQDHDFNQVVFTDAIANVKDRIGEENEGWAVAKLSLIHI